MNTSKIDYNLMGITIGGFQVFEKPTYIPLRGLTFLFGPNSAGKSAFEDAIELIFEIFPIKLWNESWTITPEPESLERHWRRLNEDKESASYAPTMTLGVTLSIHTDLVSALASSLNKELSENKLHETEQFTLPHKIEFLATFKNTEDALSQDFELATNHDLTISIDGKPIVIFEGGYFKLNFGHHVLAPLELCSDLSAVSSNYPDILEYKDGWIRLNQVHTGNALNAILDYAEVEVPKYFDYIGFIDRCKQLFGLQSIPIDLHSAISEIGIIAQELHGMVVGNIRLESPSVVAASRMVPTAKDLTFVNASSFPIESTGDKQYHDLVSPKHRSIVNHMLSEHLFIERGYQLACDHRVLISPDKYSNLEGAVLNGEHLFHLQLIDAQKRVFEFEEVGSGLGYVLPILSSACNGEKPLSILQQPELHLHPALQSALGDVFIDCLAIEQDPLNMFATQYSFGKQIVIETHSEHLLLRVLKRIRQTYNNKTVSPELKIHAENVSVLYFDPSPDGTTKVKRLRISDDGDFIDRWPRGFFTEREQDLFDE